MHKTLVDKFVTLQVRKRDNEFQVIIERWATYDGDGL
jgi:hypothetical protein